MRILSQPITAQLDANLHIIEADHDIRQLHVRAGGGDDDPIAVPALAEIARLCRVYGARISRPARVQDGVALLSLWVEAEPDGDGVRLSITSWRENRAFEPPAHGRLVQSVVHASPEGAIALQLDSALIIRGTSYLTKECNWVDPYLGQALTAAFIIEDEEGDPRPPMLSSIAERTAFVDRLVLTRETRRAWRISGQPLWDAGRHFAGYLCTLMADSEVAATAASAATPMLTGGKFAREMAPVLRQPVGRIIANAETIAAKMHGALREGYADYAGDIANAARHLQALINDLSDLEAIESDGFQPADDAIDLADVGRRVAGLLAVKASDHRVTILAPDEAEAVPAVGEFRRVLQILINLVTNAIRYSPDGSEVRIAAAHENGVAVIRVIDQGQGIAPDDWDRIFAKFERLGRSDHQGSGLGLYISRRIAEALGGRLFVEDSGLHGTTFALHLPAQ